MFLLLHSPHSIFTKYRGICPLNCAWIWHSLSTGMITPIWNFYIVKIYDYSASRLQSLKTCHIHMCMHTHTHTLLSDFPFSKLIDWLIDYSQPHWVFFAVRGIFCSWGEWMLLSSCAVQASHCGDSSCFWVWALGKGFSCGAQAQLLHGMQNLTRPSVDSMFPAPAGRFLTTGPPGKPKNYFFFFF